MISSDLLRAALSVEVAVVVVCLAAVAGHGLWLRVLRRADEPRLAEGHRVLAAAIVEAPGPASSARVEELRRLPPRLRRRVVGELAVGVTGDEGRRVGEVAESLGLVAAASRRCRSRWWWRRLLGAHQLNVYGRGDDVLPGLFDDDHPAVRAQVIEWAGDARRADLAPRLVAALQDPAALCRHAAADSILRAGAALVDALAGALTSCHGEELASLLAVLARRPDPRYRAAALAATEDELPAVRAAGAGVLGGVGGAESGEALQRLIVDPEPAVRVAAAEGLRRLDHQPAAADLAVLLRDRSFAVRQAAGGALAGLGAGGILLLRHYAAGDDPLASDMARYSLDIAALHAPR
jgi:hypothetical protein